MEPLVSIMCNTYNHEKYMRDTLEGFLMQKTDFPFEVLIHDDASTDKNTDIIREYEAKYPDIIKPIYQSENQYSKKISIARTYQYPRARGKYIAICEGDDYWTCPTKLQRQVEALEKHPEADICVCAANKTKGGVPYGIIAPADHDCVIPADMVIKGGGGFVATCALLLRTELVRSPMRFEEAFPYDYSLQIRGALRGGMVYIAEPMATYRIFGENSWTVGFYNDPGKHREFQERIKNMLEILDEETDNKYSAVINYVIKENEFFVLNGEYRFREMLSPKYREVYKKQTFKSRIKIHIRCLFPGIIKRRREKKVRAVK